MHFSINNMRSVKELIEYSQRSKEIEECENKDLSFNYIDVNKYIIFNFYCATKEESAQVKEVLKKYGTVKYFVSESKNL